MNQYVEAMARARFEADWRGEGWGRASEARKDAYRRLASEHLAALIAELRSDPAAVDAIRQSQLRPKPAGTDNRSHEEARDALCDYLAGDAGGQP